MKKLLIFTLIVSIASFLVLIVYFLISTDAYHDYVSPKALLNQGLAKKIGTLPYWAVSKGFWDAFRLEFNARVVYYLVVMVMLILLLRYKLRIRPLLIIALLFTIISGFLLIFYFSAYTDIYNDYVSRTAIKTIAPAYVDKLAEWSDCKYEWNILQLDLYVRAGYTFFITVLLSILIKSKEITQLGRKAVNHTTIII